jgi:hypothetical protein
MCDEIVWDDHFRIRLASKKLSSGKYQIKFYAIVHGKDTYGYLLVDAKDLLIDVVKTIRKRLIEKEKRGDYHHSNLYNMTHVHADQSNFMLFN